MKQIRLALGLTQEQFARALGYEEATAASARTMVMKWETARAVPGGAALALARLIMVIPEARAMRLGARDQVEA